MTYIVDTERGDMVLDLLLDQYHRGAYPYNLKSSMLSVLKMPKSLKRGGEDEARFWFFACMLMKGGIDSDVALKALSGAYDKEMRPLGLKPYRPEYAAHLDARDMTGILRDAGTGLYRLVNDWILCARIILERYDGEVLNLVNGIHDFDSAAELLRNRGKNRGFPGFQFKMVSMLLFFLTESGMIDYFPYPPPVDIHLQRVPVETEMVRRKDGTEIIAYNQREHDTLQEVLREYYVDYMVRRGYKSNEIADAVWLFSRMMCRWNPGNRTSEVGKKKGRSTKLVTHKPDWSTRRDIRKYERSCGRCVIEQLCEWNMPSRYLYVQGMIRTHGKREKTARPALFADV